MDREENFVIPKCLKFLAHKYEIYEAAGEGTFSSVFKAKCLKTFRLVAIKAITKTSSPERVLEELSILKQLNGKSSCIQLLDVMRDKDQIVAVFPLINSTDFKDFLIKCSMNDVRIYMFKLIKAVSHVHDNGYIHRDIKPSNFLYSIENEFGCLIDFGLAQKERIKPQEHKNVQTPILFFNSIVTASKPPGFYERDSRPQMKAPRAGTRGFRAPEVLFRYPNQDKSIDMWSVGVIMLSILTEQYPFFLSTEDIDGLVEIALIFGNSEMRKAAKYYGRNWKSNISSIKEESTPFSSIISSLNPNAEICEDAVDLLRGLLDLINQNRLTAKEALKHRFFKTLT